MFFARKGRAFVKTAFHRRPSKQFSVVEGEFEPIDIGNSQAFTPITQPLYPDDRFAETSPAPTKKENAFRKLLEELEADDPNTMDDPTKKLSAMAKINEFFQRGDLTEVITDYLISSVLNFLKNARLTLAVLAIILFL